MKAYFHLGKFLRQKRIQCGLSQVELAKALNINVSQFVSNWERGVCAPPGNSLQALIKILKIKKEDLVVVMLDDCRTMIESKIRLKRKSSRKNGSSNRSMA